MKPTPYIILGGGVVAGYAAREFVMQGGKKGQLAMVTAEASLPYERPSLSKGFLLGTEKRDDFLIGDSSFHRTHGIECLRRFPVTRVDFRRRTLQGLSGRKLKFDKLLIATGSTVRRLEIPGNDLNGIYYLRSLADAEAIRARIGRGKTAVVIGSGFIGMEVASVLARKGVKVTMVFPADRVWAGLFPPEVSRYFEKRFESEGVRLVRNETVVAFHGAHRLEKVLLASEGALPANFAVAGVGVTPATELFQSSPLRLEDGITVNEYLETNVPNVWAAGDIAHFPDAVSGRSRRIEHWDNAAAQGRAAMRNMMGKPEPFIHVPYFFSDVFDLSYEYWGDARGHDRLIYRGTVAAGKFSVWWFRRRRLIAAFVMNRPDEERYFAPRWILAGSKLPLNRLGDPGQRLSALAAGLTSKSANKKKQRSGA